MRENTRSSERNMFELGSNILQTCRTDEMGPLRYVYTLRFVGYDSYSGV